MLSLLSKEDSFNLKRIADALCKLANIQVLHIGEEAKELKIEVVDESLEAMAERESIEARDSANAVLIQNKNNSNPFWVEDNLPLWQLEDLNQ